MTAPDTLPEEQREARVDLLLVDDQPEGLLALEAILADLGQNLVKASSGADALRQVLAREFAAILLDVQMPVMDGFEVAELIRQLDRARYTPIIFLTAAHRSKDQVFQGYAHGAVDFLVKPVEPEVLKSKVKVFIDLARQAAEVKRLNHALSASEERLARIVETMAEGLVLMDQGGGYTFANSEAEIILGLSRDSITQRRYNDPQWMITTVDGQPFPDADLPFARVMSSGKPVHGVEMAIQVRDGARIVVSVNAAPLRDAAGALTGVVATFSDVTRRKEAERLKDEFVSTVSHELRTPLTSLRGFAEVMLNRNYPPEKQREFLTIIHNESVRLTNLINDFLDLQRFESGRKTYHFQAVNAAVLLRETSAVFNQEGAKYSLHLDLPEELPSIWADPDRFRQVLVNLISNAVKFSPEGGEIVVGAKGRGSELMVWVRDQGIGIRPADQSKLFERFFRVDNTETRCIGGTGLGLALVKEIVEAHRGRVWLESEYGKGSTFFFSLPAAEIASSGTRVQSPLEAACDVLLVEDDPVYARLVREHIEAEGYTVAVADRCDQALDLARRWPPRLALVDIHLAGVTDGWDLIMEMRNDPQLFQVPVLVISASESINLRGLAIGGGDYLLKPIPPAWLLQAVHRQLPQLGGKRVLVVDGEAGFRRDVREALLAEASLEVEEAGDGREALDSLARGMPDLLILDLILPGVDGFEVLRRLRADRRAVNLPVLIVTARNLSPEDKSYITRRLATLVHKGETSIGHIMQAVTLTLGSRSHQAAG